MSSSEQVARRRGLDMIRSCAVAGAVLALTLAGCSTGKAGSGSASKSASSSKSAELAKYQKVPEFTFAGPPIDLSKVKGKSIYSVPFSTSIEFGSYQEKVLGQLAAKAGVKYKVWQNDGSTAQQIQGMAAAIAAHPDLLLLEGSPDPRLLQPQLAQARAAGIKVLDTHFYDESYQMPPACGTKVSATCPVGVDAVVPAGFNHAGLLEADWIVQDSGGAAADVLIINSTDDAPVPGYVQTAKDELEKKCSGKCKTRTINILSKDWATQVQPQVAAALSSDPKITYIIAPIDAEVPYVNSAIQTAGKDGKIKITTFNGTPSVLNLLRTGNNIGIDVGEDLGWLAYANMDASFRMLAGMDTVHSENTAQRAFTKDNVKEAGVPAQYNQGFGRSFIAGYDKIWGIDTSSIG